MSSYTSISPDKLSRLIGTANAPTLINVRIDEHFAADPHLIPGGARQNRKYENLKGTRKVGDSDATRLGRAPAWGLRVSPAPIWR
jgi:hypothetical protein